MKIFAGLQDKSIRFKNRAIAVGVFDGIHRGHRKILLEALRFAKKYHLAPMAITFDPHPAEVLVPKRRHAFLMSLKHRLHFLGQMGFKETLVIRFDRAFSRVSHDDFLQRILIDRLGMQALSVGHDFRFGNRGLGNTLYLSRQSGLYGFRLHIEPAMKLNGRVISSTAIRALIQKGNLKKAASMLGRPVSLHGRVVRGKRRGRRLGFPTANLDPQHETLPPPGVYGVWAIVGGKRAKAVLHIGSRPTFSEHVPSIEVHLIDRRQGSLYGTEIEVVFFKRLRAVRRFDSAGDLVRAIQRDVATVSKILGS